MLKKVNFRRDHVASCNGVLQQMETKVEQDLHDPQLSAEERATLVEEWTEREMKRKAQRLAQFQRDVKNRVSAREKLIQKELADASNRAMLSEQKAAERLKESTIKVRRCVAKTHDIEDVKVTSSGRDSRFSQFQNTTNSSAAQRARNALLSQSHAHCCSSPNKDTNVANETKTSPEKKLHYHDVRPLSAESCTRRLSASTSVSSEDAKSAMWTAKRFTAPGQVEHMEKLQAGRQYLVLRRLYSNLEREQVQKKKMRDSHLHKVKIMKKHKEAQRRKMEGEVNCVESPSIMSTSLSEDKRIAMEWEELMLLEEQKQQEQKAKETDRYAVALKIRLKELMNVKHPHLPPLCSCGKTLWDTNPDTCANNCIFYKNPKAYIRALSNLLPDAVTGHVNL